MPIILSWFLIVNNNLIHNNLIQLALSLSKDYSLDMPKLIVFLGNPGKQYSHTRHNVGWIMCDSFIANKGFSQTWTNKFHAQYIKKGDIILLKPQTFMNESGFSVQEVANFYDISCKNILVVHDDIELPFGSIKMQQGGGMGGHNGLRSVKNHLGSDSFCRLRIGVGRPPSFMQVADFVLRRFSPQEEGELEEIQKQAVQKIEEFEGYNEK